MNVEQMVLEYKQELEKQINVRDLANVNIHRLNGAISALEILITNNNENVIKEEK